MKKHPELAKTFLADEARTNWHNKNIKSFRLKRDLTVKTIPEWEKLRTLAAQIKDHCLSHLDDYLLEFEAKAIANGVQVHWASEPADLNHIVHSILEKKDVTRVVKSKSMLTEECGLNEYLEEKGLEIIDTDLGERIIQMRKEGPSHFVAPAIHLKREEVSELFHEQLHTEKDNFDPTYLTRAARSHLREKFLHAEAGITGVNFAVAETGSVTVVTNEGNSDLGCHIPPIQIHCMGIEKLIPKWDNLGVFIRMLAASSTGQRITIYTSHYLKPKVNGEMHIVLLDNGRSSQLGKKDYKNSLRCIRCAACVNTCPVYRRSGGYSYHNTISGPIGAILMPNRDLDANSDLPFASSLCGSCSDVCPVKIDIHQQLYKWRQEIVEKGKIAPMKKKGLEIAGKVLSRRNSFQRWSKRMKFFLKKMPRWMIYNSFNKWGEGREMPEAPPYSFAQWYRKNRIK